MAQFCPSCGKPLPGQGKFCPGCGAVIQRPAAPEDGTVRVKPGLGAPPAPKPGKARGPAAPPAGTPVSAPPPAGPASGSSGRKKGKLFAILVPAAVVVLAGIVLGLLFLKSSRLNGQYEALRAGLTGADTVRSVREAVSDVDRAWEAAGAFSFSEKQEVLDRLSAVSQSARTASEGLAAQAVEADALLQQAESCRSSLSAPEYEKLITAWRAALVQRDDVTAGKLQALARDGLNALKNGTVFTFRSEGKPALLDENGVRLAGGTAAEPKPGAAAQTPAQTAGRDPVGSEAAQVQTDRPEAPATEAAPATTAAPTTQAPTEPAVTEPAAPLQIRVQQVDVRSFPEIRLYVEIRDGRTGEIPDHLDSTLFFLDKRDATGSFVRQVVTQVGQLNQKEKLSVVMVADVSGSMEGSPLREAKSVMDSFLRSVQFSTGDQVTLIAFSTGVQLVEEFTGDLNLLLNDVNRLSTDNMTSLYDALYTGIFQAAAQDGARCVIAFTDGKDNYSSTSIDLVIDTASRYNVPIFIIGVGSVDTYELRRICERTGGAYYDAGTVSGMGSLYDEIYRLEKELYLVSFRDSTTDSATDRGDISLQYAGPDYEGSCTYTYEPSVLIDVEDDSFYLTGPERVAEAYIKGFADARTYGDFSYIEPYLKPGSKIYNDQKAFVREPLTLRLQSFEIVGADYSDKNHCILTTYETYYIQRSSKPLTLLTQRCRYNMEVVGTEWKLTSFADLVEVISEIRQ